MARGKVKYVNEGRTENSADDYAEDPELENSAKYVKYCGECHDV